MPINVVLVEDDADLNRSLVATFEFLGVSCQAFMLGNSAIAHDYTGVDAIIADFNLPDTNGVEVVRKIRERFPNIPALIISASRTAYMVMAANTIPNCKILFKPIDIDAMKNFIEGLDSSAS